MLIKIVCSIVFAVFGIMAGIATYDLGFGLYGIAGAVFVIAAMMWEIWVQPGRDDARRKKLLGKIITFTNDVMYDDGVKWKKVPGNISDAQDEIKDLRARLEQVAIAYGDELVDVLDLNKELLGRIAQLEEVAGDVG